MEITPTLLRYVWLAGIGIELVLAIRLLKDRLHSVYPVLFAFLVADVVRSLVALPLDPRTNFYAHYYFVSESLIRFLYFLVVLELCGLVLRDHPGLATFGRWAVSAGMLIAVTLSIATLYPTLSAPNAEFPVLHWFHAVDRGLVSSLLFFLLAITAFWVWYPVPLRRNTLYYCGGYFLLFLVRALLLLYRNWSGPDAARLVGLGNMLALSGVLAAWILLINRRGEESIVRPGHSWEPSEAERLVGQLKEVNQMLMRSANR